MMMAPLITCSLPYEDTSVPDLAVGTITEVPGFEDGDTIGVFLVENGFNNNNGYEGIEGGSFTFVNQDGDPATVNDTGLTLVHIADDGTQTTLDGNIFHASEASETLNGDGTDHANLEGNDDGTFFTVDFEDQVTVNDQDFNDLNLEVVVTGGSVDLTDSTFEADTIFGTTSHDSSLEGTDDGEVIRALSGNDTVFGGDGNDTIFGEAGNDELDGGAGDDVFKVGSGDGSDNFDGGEGVDTIEATEDNVAITIDNDFGGDNSVEVISSGGNEGVSVTGDASSNVLDFSETTLDGIEEIGGGSGNDTITGTDGDDVIVGGRGNDELDGGAGDDVFKVGSGDGSDNFDGGEGVDTIEATEDNVAITIDNDFDGDNSVEVISSGGNEGVSVTGDASSNVLDFSETTLDGIEEIGGGSGNDTITGTDGDDVIVGGRGNDELDGGAGDDVFRVGSGDGSDNFDGGEGVDTIEATEDNVAITIDNDFDGDNSVEVISSGGNEGVSVTGDASSNVLDFSETTLDGIEEIGGGSGNDTITGTDGDDVIVGGRGNDELDGGAGDDVFRVGSGDGSDNFDGGEGVDTIEATEDNVAITIDNDFDGDNSVEVISSGGNEGVSVTGDASSNVLDFSETTLDGIEEIGGGNGHDTIIGTDGDDVIVGGRGNDELDGGAGDDVFRVGSDDGSDNFDGGEGVDTIEATEDNVAITIDNDFGGDNSVEVISSGGNEGVSVTGDGSHNTLDFSETTLDGIEEIGGGAGNDTITGTGGDDVIAGGIGNDKLDGGAGDDTIDGGDHNDVIDGGTGDDVLSGGTGSDTVVYGGTRDEYTITETDDGRIQVQDSVEDRDGTDIITDDFDHFEFEDGVIDRDELSFDVPLEEAEGDISPEPEPATSEPEPAASEPGACCVRARACCVRARACDV